MFESGDIGVTGEYGKYITNNDGTLKSDYKEYYKSYDNLHYGIDLVRKYGADIILASISGKVVSNSWNAAEGWTVQMNYGYKFENTFVSSGIFGEYGHLKEQSKLTKGEFYKGTETVGLFGNTGEKSTGAHLHYSVYTQNNVKYSSTTMKTVFGKEYQKGSMYNGSWRTVYDPTLFYERYTK